MAYGIVQVNATFGQSMVVNITRASGGVPVAYTDATLATPIALPATISSTTQFFMVAPESYVISVKVNGQESATSQGTTLTSLLPENDALILAPSPSLSAEVTANSGTYAVIAKRRRTMPAPWAGSRNTAGIASTTATVETSRKCGYYAYNTTEIRLVFIHANPGNGSGGDAAPATAITFKAGFEPKADGTVVPVYFGGKRTVTMDGGVLISDPIVVEGTVATKWACRTYLSAGTAYATFVSEPSQGEGATATTDLTDPGAAAVTTNFAFHFGPVGIIAMPRWQQKLATIGIVGDSIAFGQGDQGIGAGRNGGFAVRALGVAGSPVSTTNFGYVQAAVAGERALDLVLNGREFRGQLVADCTDILLNHGVNDVFGAGRTLAQIQGDWLTLWTWAAALGARVWQTTITPKTTSTDAWATTVNQTIVSGNAVRLTANAWLRAGAPIDPTSKAAVAIGTPGALVAGGTGHPLSGYFEVADTVETARDSGLWKVDGAANTWTVDGTHPSSVGAAAMAAAVSTAGFVPAYVAGAS